MQWNVICYFLHEPFETLASMLLPDKDNENFQLVSLSSVELLGNYSLNPFSTFFIVI